MIEFTTEQLLDSLSANFGMPTPTLRFDESIDRPLCHCADGKCELVLSSRCSISRILHEFSHAVQYARLHREHNDATLAGHDEHGEDFVAALADVLRAVWLEPMREYAWEHEYDGLREKVEKRAAQEGMIEHSYSSAQKTDGGRSGTSLAISNRNSSGCSAR
jgi:hypothetical protein